MVLIGRKDNYSVQTEITELMLVLVKKLKKDKKLIRARVTHFNLALILKKKKKKSTHHTHTPCKTLL